MVPKLLLSLARMPEQRGCVGCTCSTSVLSALLGLRLHRSGSHSATVDASAPSLESCPAGLLSPSRWLACVHACADGCASASASAFAVLQMLEQYEVKLPVSEDLAHLLPAKAKRQQPGRKIAAGRRSR